MRTLLAIAILAGGAAIPSQAADPPRKYKRGAERYDPYYYNASPRYSREQVECERARHEDPAGVYQGFPCWAREAFGRGSNSGGATRR
jgi:hypothetical protein